MTYDENYSSQNSAFEMEHDRDTPTVALQKECEISPDAVLQHLQENPSSAVISMESKVIRETLHAEELHMNSVESGDICTLCLRIPVVWKISKYLKKKKSKMWLKFTLCFILLALYFTYFVAVLLIRTEKELNNYWCEGDGFLILITIFAAVLLIYFQIIKPYCIPILSRLLTPVKKKSERYTKLRWLREAKYVLASLAYVTFLFVDTKDDFSRLVSAFGAFVLIGVGVLISAYPLKIRLTQIIWGLSLQLLLGLFILRWQMGKNLFECLGKKVSTFLSFTDVGTYFALGEFLRDTHSYAFKILPVIVFFGMLVSILNHFGIIQWIIIKLGWILEVTMGTTPCESMATAANIFLGQSEAPLVIKPYIAQLTKSEIHTVLTGGFATVAGGILAAYIAFGIEPAHLLSASLMSAPAAMTMSKVLYPETEKSLTKSENIKIRRDKRKNILHTIMDDLLANLPLIANITGVLLIFLAAGAFLNAVANWSCLLVGYEDGVCSIQSFLGYLLSPIAWLMGVPMEDCLFVGSLLGTKLFISEFYAYKQLTDRFREGLVSARSVVITTYALCGFSGIPSMGCQIGAMSCYAPSRVKDVVSVSLRAFIAGNLACFLTACIAGTLIKDPATRPSVFNNETVSF